MKKNTVLGLFLTAALAQPCLAARRHPAAGSTSASFLKLEPGPRALALSAFSAAADDAYAVYWNPAGLTQLASPSASFMHALYVEGIDQEFGVYAHPFAYGTWAVSFGGVFVPHDLERRSGEGEANPLAPLTADSGRFGAQDLSLGLSYAADFVQSLSAGATLKLIRSSIDKTEAHAAAFDAGLLWRANEAWSWGASLQNGGAGLKFDRTAYDLPLNVKLGAAYRPLGGRLLWTADFNKAIDDYPALSAGMEYWLMKYAALRAGYSQRLHGNELGVASGVSAGVGFKFKRMAVDYAFLPRGALGDTHRMSLSVALGNAWYSSIKAVQPAVSASSRVKTTAAQARAARPGVYPLTASFRAKTISSSGQSYEVTASGPSGHPVTSLVFKRSWRGSPSLELELVEESSAAPADYKVLAGPYRLLGASTLTAGGITVSYSAEGDAALYAFIDGQWEKQPSALVDSYGTLKSFVAESEPMELFFIGSSKTD